MPDAAHDQPERRTGLAQRARDGLIAITEAEEASTAAAHLQVLKNACEQAEEVTAQLHTIQAVAAELSVLGLEMQFKVPGAVTGARRQLRTVATSVDAPSETLTNRLRSAATQGCLKAARNAADQFEAQAWRVVVQEGARLRPLELDSLASTVPHSAPVSARLSILQRDFDTRRSKPLHELPTVVRRWREHAERWDENRTAAQEALSRLHPEVAAFMNAATAPEGASWSMITPAVREWLDLDDNSIGYRTRYTNGV